MNRPVDGGTAPVGLEVHGLSVSFDGVPVLAGVDLTVAPGELVVLLGPSGCGKSTLLRTVAGLEQPVAGGVWWDGVDLARVPTHERGFGLVFQDHALFGHRDVAGNVDFGLRVAGMPSDQRAQRVARALALVGLDGFGGRRVDTLSGGEAQRVALARSLAAAPRLLMLDEPLGSLDRSLRERLTAELGTLLRRLGLAALHVTHDHDEAFALADRIAVMGGGRIDRIGTPDEVWADPGTVHAARCLGHENLVVLDADGGCALGRLGSGSGTVLVRADCLSVAPVSGGVDAIVASVSRRAGRLVATVVVGDLSVRFPLADGHDAGVGSTLRPGDRVDLVVAAGAVVRLVD
ncbi:MAG: ABC transporter ATP-binding protein [Acidimicrobiales bacterium]|nr:ABC transporter ATP-binding protein [Acidimicrobiales bacterium]